LNNSIIETVFDSGSNISCVSYKFIKQLNLKIWKYKNENLNFKTVSNTQTYLGRVTINLTIGLITEKCNLIVIKDSNQSLVLGLDLINKFKLKILQNYKIFQNFEINDKIFNEEILTNYSNTEQNSKTIFNNNDCNELKINLSEISFEKCVQNEFKPNTGLNENKKQEIFKLLNKY
jgi:hypothetical protein